MYIFNVIKKIVGCREHRLHGVFDRMIKSIQTTDSIEALPIVENFLKYSDFEEDDNYSIIYSICKACVDNLKIPSFDQESFDEKNETDMLMTANLQIYNAYKTSKFIAVKGEEQGVGKSFAINKVLSHKESQGKKFIRIYPLSYGAKYLVEGSNNYSVSKIIGSFLTDIGENGGTIHFCGTLDNEFRSCLETITTDSPYMLLENGEYATLPNNLNFMFEITDIKNDLPQNIVDQAALISIPNKKLEITVKLFQSWLADLTLLRKEDEVRDIIEGYLQKFHVIFCKSLNILQKTFPSILAPRFIAATVSLLKFFTGLLENQQNTDDECTVIRAYLYSLCWAFSGYLVQQDRRKFIDLVRDEVESSGYFNIQVEWDFINGKLNTDGSITPWNKIKDCEVDEQFFSYEDNFTSVESQEIAAYLILKNILHNRHFILTGPSGTGKSELLQRVAEKNSKIIFKDIVEFYMTASTTASEVEELIMGAMKRRIQPFKILLVLYNLDFNNVHQLELARSLCENRSIYLTFQKRWITMSDVTVCIESSTKIGQESPVILQALVSKAAVVTLEENFEELEELFAEQLEEFLTEELEMEDEELPPKLAKLMVSIYKDAKKVSSLFTRHNVMRCLKGVLKGNKKVVKTLNVLLQLIHLEMTAEFHDCLAHQHLKRAYLDIHERYFDMLFSITPDVLEEFDNQYVLMFKIDEEELSDAEDQEDEKELQFVEHDQLEEILREAYPKIRGKLNLSSYDEKIVFSLEYKQYFINLLRALDTDLDIIIIGEAGVGKRSMARFATLFMGLELITMDGEESDWREVFRGALLDASRDEADMIIVVGPELVEDHEVLATISDIRAYGFSWNLIDDYERKDLLYADHEDPFMSLFSKSKYEEMDNSLTEKVNHNLNFVFCLEDIDMIDKMVNNYPFIMRNCVSIYITPWSDTTMTEIALDRLEELSSKKSLNVDNIAKCCSSLHQFCRETYEATTSSQYLEFVALLPEMYDDMYEYLLKSRKNLQIGIEQAVKAQTHIDKLNDDITAKEPEIKKLTLESEQLGKRLTQERQNLEKASQSFRKKEAKARARSEITQELAADTHQSLEQALPHLDASIQAINSLDKGEIAELRGLKQVPELVLNVLEAVCILLGVKPDWPTAKNLISEPTFMQMLIEFDKDNVSDATLKRIRRYIESPKFVPDEVGKVSRACCSLCLWVRAIDYYAKVFKTIEPKRIKLLQAESELAEAMTSLRKETDRVTHIETTITNIQQSLNEKQKRKTALEKHISDLQSNLERAEQLAYSLEEELKKWRSQLNYLDNRLECLGGDCILGGMLIAYGGQFEFKERENAVKAWREVCEKFRISVSDRSILEIFEPVLKIEYLRADTLPPFNFYQENCLIVQKSKKWILFDDPDNLARTWIHQAESSNIVEIELHDPALIRKLKISLNKGHIFLIDNFSKDYPSDIENLIQYEIYEKLKVFVGLIGIPEKKKELKVMVGDQEVTVHPNFKLYLRSESVQDRKQLQEFLKVVNFKMSVELYNSTILKLLVKEDNPAMEEMRVQIHANQYQRKDEFEKEKDIILRLLYNAQGALLDDEDLISNITDAKARVVKAINAQREAEDASMEMAKKIRQYHPLTNPLAQLFRLIEKLKEIDPIYYIPTETLTSTMMNIWRDKKDSGMRLEAKVQYCLKETLRNLCQIVTMALHVTHRLTFLLFFVVKVVHDRDSEEEKEEAYRVLNNFILKFEDDEEFVEEIAETTKQRKPLFSRRLINFLVTIKGNFQSGQPILGSVATFVESELRKNGIELDVMRFMKRTELREIPKKPLLIVEHGLLDTLALIGKFANRIRSVPSRPRLLVMGKHLEFGEIQNTVDDCKNTRQILILQGIHNQVEEMLKLKIPEVDDEFMIYATIPGVNMFAIFLGVNQNKTFKRKKIYLFACL